MADSRWTRRTWWKLAGLGAALGGDICLVLLRAPVWSWTFLFGVAFFTLAHLLWTVANLGEVKPDGRILFFAAVPLVFFCVVRLGPRMPWLVYPLALYALASSLDLATAFASRRWFYFLGVLLLVFSDVMIGGRMLHMPGCKWLVGPLYVAALVMLYLSTFRRVEPRFGAFGKVSRWEVVAGAVATFAAFLTAALVYPEGVYNPCMRMLSRLGRTVLNREWYPLCHYFFTAGMVLAAVSVLRVGRDWGAAVNAAGLLLIAVVPENVVPDIHNAGCWLAVAGGVLMLHRRGDRAWGIALIAVSSGMGICLVLQAGLGLIPFAPWVTTAQKVLILTYAAWVVKVGWRETARLGAKNL